MMKFYLLPSLFKYAWNIEVLSLTKEVYYLDYHWRAAEKLRLMIRVLPQEQLDSGEGCQHKTSKANCNVISDRVKCLVSNSVDILQPLCKISRLKYEWMHYKKVVKNCFLYQSWKRQEKENCHYHWLNITQNLECWKLAWCLNLTCTCWKSWRASPGFCIVGTNHQVIA